MNQYIVSDPAVMMGKPVVAGTRFTVELLLEKLAAGETTEQLLEAHPRLTREGIAKAITEAMNKVVADVGDDADDFGSAAARRFLDRVEC